MDQVDPCQGLMFQDAKPDTPETSDSTGDEPKGALAVLLARDPELSEVVHVWKLLDQPIRQAILGLIRGKRRG